MIQIVILLLLDASKAFDRFEYVELFTTCRNRKVCPIVLRLLMNMYINQQIQVKWNNMISPTCTISNGVKQGGCMSPTLFSIYLDKLLGILRASNVGCRYGNHYMGAFCYAGDISLLSPTVSGLQDMLKICERYTDKYKIHFNASKSQLLCFNTSTCTKSKDIKVYIEGLELKRTISTFFKKWAKCTFLVLSNHTLRVRSHCILYLVKNA